MKRTLIIVLTLMSLHTYANQAIIDSLKTTFPEISAKNIKDSPIKGFKEIIVDTVILYITEDGQYLMRGDLFNMKTGANLTDDSKATIVKDILAAVKDEDKIIFKAKNEKYVVDVFTDPDCPYCRKLHKGMEEMNDLGITIKYLSFPRSGKNTKSYYKSVSIWCSDDRKDAITKAKNLQEIPAKTCDNPVDEHLGLVRKLGLTGTPTGFLANGKKVAGYLPPKAYFKRLQQLSN